MKLDTTLYFITDSTGLDESKYLNIIEQACLGGASIVQLREKNISDRELLDLGFKVKKITDRYNVPLLVDDRLDIAAILDCAGVHLGQSDVNIKYARKLLGENKIVGATAKTVEQAKLAEYEGADYLGVGAIFDTTTKVKTKITDIATLNDICENVNIKVNAIGGLNIDNIDILKSSPIDGICVVSAIMQSDNPKLECEALKNKFLKMRKSNS